MPDEDKGEKADDRNRCSYTPDRRRVRVLLNRISNLG